MNKIIKQVKMLGTKIRIHTRESFEIRDKHDLPPSVQPRDSAGEAVAGSFQRPRPVDSGRCRNSGIEKVDESLESAHVQRGGDGQWRPVQEERPRTATRVGLFRPIQFVIVIVLFTTDCVPLVVVKQNKHKGPFCKNKLR